MNSAISPRSRMALLVGFGLVSLLLHGCGGSGHGGAAPTSSGSSNSAHAAQATVTVSWPARPQTTGAAPRLIPLASNSITITITQGGHAIAAHTLIRPAGDQAVSTSYTFGQSASSGSSAGDNLPVGVLTATASAYPSADGTGTAQASGSMTIITTPGTSTPITIHMGSTIDHLGITPASPTVAVGTTTPLTATAYDAAGGMVLTTASKVQWSSSAPNIASVDANSGVVKSIAEGSSVLTVTESESGLVGTTSIVVTGSDGTGTGGGTAAYTVTDLGTLPSDTDSFAYGINSAGQVVGDSSGSKGFHAFLYSNGRMQDLGTLPGDVFSSAYGINSAGQVIGESLSTLDKPHAFLYSNGTMHDLGTLPGDTGSVAYGINNAGQIVGYYNTSNAGGAFLYSSGQMRDLTSLITTTSSLYLRLATGINNNGQICGATDNTQHAFLYSSGQVQDLGVLPGYNSSYATGINSAGQVIGVSLSTLDKHHAFLYSNGTMHDLGTLPGDDQSSAHGINSTGEVVGDSYGSKDSHAFLYSNGTIQNLNWLIPANSGWVLENARGINDNGQICGEGFIDGHAHAFLLTPVAAAAHLRH